jgi:sulfoxide reductase heme-binding subunit YedZ
LTTTRAKALILVAGLAPLAALVAAGLTDNLGANPIEYITHQTGTLALGFLVLTLTITPLRRLAKWHAVIRVRRMLGLFAFFYASLHLMTWVILDQFFDVAAMVEDVVKRPYITAGMVAFLCMVPLALTSSTEMIRRLGRRWQTLHRLTYAAAVAGVVHFWWLVKADLTEPQRWAAVLTILLGMRLWWLFRGNRARMS